MKSLRDVINEISESSEQQQESVITEASASIPINPATWGVNEIEAVLANGGITGGKILDSAYKGYNGSKKEHVFGAIVEEDGQYAVDRVFVEMGPKGCEAEYGDREVLFKNKKKFFKFDDYKEAQKLMKGMKKIK